MKKTPSILLTLAAIILFSGNVFSQKEEGKEGGSSASAFEDGSNLFFAGFGIPPNERIKNDFKNKYNNNIFDYKFKNYGTGVLKYERGLHKYFGIGLNLEYSASSVTFNYEVVPSTPKYEKKINNSLIGGYVRFNGHYSFGGKVDLYGGAGLGYRYTLNKFSDSNPNPVIDVKQKETIFEFDYQFTLGARFMVKDKVGLFIEGGWASTPAQIGVVFKF